MTRHLTRSALALAALTTMAACGSAGAKGAAQVASVASDATTTTTAAAGGNTSEADAQQAMLDFAACMREHGVDMPDPQFNGDGNGTFTVGGPGIGGTDVDKAKLDEAQKTCQPFLDKVRSNMPPPDPAKMEEEKQKLLAFAQCMRDHGIDFPDPQINTDGGGLQVQLGGPGMDPNSPGFKEANDACSKDAGLPGFGTAGGEGSGPAIAVTSDSTP
jgi:hypothetical protein